MKRVIVLLVLSTFSFLFAEDDINSEDAMRQVREQLAAAVNRVKEQNKNDTELQDLLKNAVQQANQTMKNDLVHKEHLEKALEKAVREDKFVEKETRDVMGLNSKEDVPSAMAKALSFVAEHDDALGDVKMKYSAPSGDGRYDAAFENVGRSGTAGALWIFWAVDAPSTEYLPPLIIKLTDAMPDLHIYDVHMISPKQIRAKLQEGYNYKLQLEYNDPDIDDIDEIPAKNVILNKVKKIWAPYTTMSQLRRHGGYNLWEDVRAAQAFNITKIPTIVFISPSKTVHKLEGIGSRTDAVEWIRRCHAWEELHLQTAKEKLLPGEEN